MKNKCFYIAALLIVSVFGCKTSTEPSEESAGVYLPSNAGSTWTYILNGHDTVFREALGPHTFDGVTYQLLRDRYSVVLNDSLGNPHPSFVFDSQYIRSDANNIYQLAAIDPLAETIQLEKKVGSNWTYFDSTSLVPLIIENDYSTLQELPDFSVGDSIYHTVLKVRITQFVSNRPNQHPVSIMSYFAKGLGQVAESDSAGTKLNLTLVQYHLK